MKTITTIEECRKILKEEIKTFPDWPEKGVNFKDVQSILFKPELALLTSHYLQELLPKQESDFLFNKAASSKIRSYLYPCTASEGSHS